MQRAKIEKVKDWMWDYFDFRYSPAYWIKPQRLLRKSDLTDEDAEMYEEYYDNRDKLIQQFPEPFEEKING